MLQSGDGELRQYMEPVARAIFGDPNPHLSSKTELRFGTHGSMDIDLQKGTAFSHEENVGGGVLWLIAREKKLTGKAAFDFMREIGCDMEEPSKPRRIVETYDYTDEAGDLLFHVCRFDPKFFAQRAPDGTWKVKGIRQVPYRLPELMEALAEGKTIFVVEGEKDANNLARWNIPATCNAGGAGKWRREFAELFAGADVVVVPDNDEAGRQHAEQVAASLQGIAVRVRYLALPGLPPKGDVSDYMVGAQAEQFHELVAAAPIWTPQAETFVSKFGAMPWEEIGTATGTVGYTWFVEDIVPLGEITLGFGDSGSGKSFDMFDMGMAGARGTMWNGRNVEPGLVVYVAAEAGKGFVKRKIAYAMHHKLEGAEPLPFVLLTKRPDLFHDDNDMKALGEEIKAICKRYKQRLVATFYDTLSALAPGMNENASQDVSMVRKRLVYLLDLFPTAAHILVHHKPKNGSTPRGHGSLTADFETTIEFETMVDKKTEHGRTIHRATVRKQRESKPGIFWEFTLPVIEVGRNKWGNPETSCIVEPYNTAANTPRVGFHATSSEKLFLRALYDAIIDHGQDPPVGLPKIIAKVVEQRHVRLLMKERMIAPHEDSSIADGRFRVAFKRAGDKLRDGGVVGIQGNLLWPTGKPVMGFSSMGET